MHRNLFAAHANALPLPNPPLNPNTTEPTRYSIPQNNPPEISGTAQATPSLSAALPKNSLLPLQEPDVAPAVSEETEMNQRGRKRLREQQRRANQAPEERQAITERAAKRRREREAAMDPNELLKNVQSVQQQKDLGVREEGKKKAMNF